MVHLEGGGLLHQATVDAVLQCANHPLYLPVGFAVVNSDVAIDNAQPSAEPCEAAHKLVTIVHLDVVWLAPVGDHIIVEELTSPLSV